MQRSRLASAIIALSMLVVAQILAPAARAQSLLRDAETEQFFRDIGEPPFAAEETTSTDDGDEPVLGLDAPAPAVHDTDEDDPKQS